MDIAAWLTGLGLEHYADVFQKNDVDGGVLPGLTGDDLREMGVTSIGHRRKLLEAIAGLQTRPPSGADGRVLAAARPRGTPSGASSR